MSCSTTIYFPAHILMQCLTGMLAEPQIALMCMRNTWTNLAGTSKESVEECTLDDWRAPLQGLAARPGRTERAVVALGKFDALHKGHRCSSLLSASAAS